MCNPKNLAYLCSTSHVGQSYATRLSKSFVLVEILPIEIDDFHPNLATAAHIWPQRFIGRLLFVFTTIVISVLLLIIFIAAVTVVAVTIGDRCKEQGQLFGPNRCFPLLLATPTL
jgi:hypothetical protein